MKNNICLLFISLLLIMFSCKPQVPGKYLQPDEFEDILYDYHLADAMVDNNGTNEAKYQTTLYRQAVLKKYGITQAEFDSSLVYYVRHADRLHKIYENLSKRLSDEALALGASANDISQYGDMTSAKDTSNMWRGVPSCVLMPDAPYNTMSFEINADSTYHNGDKLIFSFNSNFIFKDGVRDGVAMLAIQFKNDSIASTVIHLSSNSSYSLTVSDTENNGIKAIRGFIYLNKSTFEQSNNSLSLMSISNIRLIRMRNNGLNNPSKADNQTPGNRDTLQRMNNTGMTKRADSINRNAQPASQTATPIHATPNGPMQMRRVAPTMQKMQAQ